MTDDRLTQFGLRLRELREAAGLTRKELAQQSGLSERGIVKWELAEREPGWFGVVALAKALGVEVGAFTVAPQEREPAGRGRPKDQYLSRPRPLRKPERQVLTVLARTRTPLGRQVIATRVEEGGEKLTEHRIARETATYRELLAAGLITSKVLIVDIADPNSPTETVYSITTEGRKALKERGEQV